MAGATGLDRPDRGPAGTRPPGGRRPPLRQQPPPAVADNVEVRHELQRQQLLQDLYIGAGFGPGPRDGLTTAIAARGHQIRVVRTLVEVTVLAAGWLLGGSVGAGTVLYAALIGPITHRTIPLFTRKTRLPNEWRSP